MTRDTVSKVFRWGCRAINLPMSIVATFAVLAVAVLPQTARGADPNLRAWGYSSYGQCTVPALPAGVIYTQVAGGYSHSLALRSDGVVVAFGDNGSGQCNVPALPAGVLYTQVAGGYLHSLALRSDGQAVAFGNNDYGQCTVPTLPAGAVYTQVAGGWYHGLALTKIWVTVTLNGDALMYVLLAGTFTDPGATAQDDQGNSLSVTTTGAVNVNALGTYTLTYTATDGSGHTGTATRTVKILKKLPGDLWTAMMPSYTRSLTYANAALNEPITVWGRAWGGTPPYSYVLDFGDGSTPSTGSGISAASATFIGTPHTYSSSGSKTATLTVTDAAGKTYARQAVIRVINTPTHDERVNMAIEKGLLWLYRNQTVLDQDRIYWNVYGWNHLYAAGCNGAAVLAFEENGHLAKLDYEVDIYAETVQKGLNHILDNGNGARYSIYPHSDGIAVRDSDSNGNGYGAYLTYHNYANSFAAMAVTLAHNSAQEASADIIQRGPFKGMSYYDLIVDILDQYSFSQGDGSLRGAWRYNINTPNYGDRDGSAMQWPALAFKATIDRWGLRPPQWMLDNAVFAFQQLQRADGGACYNYRGQWPNLAKTGGMLIEYAAGNKWPGDTDVDRGLSYIGTYWYQLPNIGANEAGWSGEFYAMYGLKKGLQLQGVETLFTPRGVRNWYQDMSAWLLGNASLLDPNLNPGYRSAGYGFGQLSAGNWNNSGWINNGPLSTAHAILILTRAVTVPLPVAVIAPIPDQSAKNPASFALDGSGSYHLDPNSSIVEWLWDYSTNNFNPPDGNGKSVSVNPGWTVPGTYTITLRVKDNQDPVNYAYATAPVIVTLNNVSPVAVPIPPERQPQIYSGKIGETICLDGTQSYDPDGDKLISFSWDLNGDGIYGSAADVALDTSGQNAHAASATVVFQSEYTGQVGLQVCDQWTCSRNRTTIDVYASPSDLYVEAISASNVVPGSSADIHVVFKNDANSGKAFTDVLVKFYNGNPFTTGSPVGANYLVNLPIGGSATLDVHLENLGGAERAYVYLDANNVIPEWNEENNVAWVNVWNTPPTATFPAMSPLACNTPKTVVVILDDPDKDAMTVVWTVDGEVYATHVVAAGATSDSITKVFGFGTHTVQVSVTDGKSEPVIASISVLVLDDVSPTIACPSDITVNNDPDQCGAVVTWTPPVANDNCGVTSVDCTPASGSVFAVSTTLVTCVATDDKGNRAECSFNVTVVDAQPPTITCPADTQVNAELLVCSAIVSGIGPVGTGDNCPGSAVAYTLAGATTGTGAKNASGTAFNVGTTIVTYTITDAAGLTASCSFNVTVVNPDPVVTLTGPASGSLYAINTPVSFSATFTDAGGGTHTGTWTFDSLSQAATIAEPGGATPGSATATYSFTAAGVYTVKLAMNDSCGGSGTADQMNGIELLVIVYDPSAGFVTGGGWIDSPPGAYVADPTLTGKANFGFVSKYLKGAQKPTGQTEFQFKAGDLNFHSSTYQWLVVSGPRAQYKGTGQINGAGNYGFLLSGTDGQITGGGGVDKFRIKIWDIDNSGAIVYDNVLGTSDDIDKVNPQAIAGGSIVIHR